MFFFEVLRRGGEKFLTKHTASGRGQRFRVWFLRYGMITVFIPAFLPIPVLPFKAFCACAGAMGLRASDSFWCWPPRGFRATLRWRIWAPHSANTPGRGCVITAGTY